MNNEIMKIIMKKHKKRLTPCKAIKTYCREICCCGDILSWKECTFTECPLFGYRFGHRLPKTDSKSLANPIFPSKNTHSKQGVSPDIQKIKLNGEKNEN